MTTVTGMPLSYLSALQPVMRFNTVDQDSYNSIFAKMPDDVVAIYQSYLLDKVETCTVNSPQFLVSQDSELKLIASDDEHHSYEREASLAIAGLSHLSNPYIESSLKEISKSTKNNRTSDLFNLLLFPSGIMAIQQGVIASLMDDHVTFALRDDADSDILAPLCTIILPEPSTAHRQVNQLSDVGRMIDVFRYHFQDELYTLEYEHFCYLSEPTADQFMNAKTHNSPRGTT